MSASKIKVVTEQMLADMQPQAMVYRGIVTDLDATKKQGVYNVNNPQAGTFPQNPNLRYSILEVFVRGSIIHQRLTAKTGIMALRHFETIWSKWSILTPVQEE